MTHKQHLCVIFLFSKLIKLWNIKKKHNNKHPLCYLEGSAGCCWQAVFISILYSYLCREKGRLEPFPACTEWGRGTPCGLSRISMSLNCGRKLGHMWLTLSFKSKGVNSSRWPVYRLHIQRHTLFIFFLTAQVLNWKMCVRVCLQIGASQTTSATKGNIKLHHYDRR